MSKKPSFLRLAAEMLLGSEHTGANRQIVDLTPAQKRRLAARHLDAAVTLDIETTGFSHRHNVVTVVGLHHLRDGREEAFIRGRNMGDVQAALDRIELIVTYNGDRFDLPFLRRNLGIEIRTPHIDLMPVLRAYGYTGGQKALEKRFGLRRRDSEGVDGHFAVALWRMYERTGDEEALEKLVTYNLEDCRMLAEILRLFCGKSGAS